MSTCNEINLTSPHTLTIMTDCYSTTAPIFRSCGVQIPLSGAQLRNSVEINHYVPEHLRKYAVLRAEGKDFDATIIIGKQAVHAHKALLCVRIPLLRDLLNANTSGDIVLPEIDCATFNCLLECAYTGHVTITGTNVEDLMRGAAALGMEAVMDACAGFMQSRLRADNVLSLLAFCRSIEYHKIDNFVLRYVDRNFVHISNTPEFLKLSVEELEALLSRDSLKVEEEMDVFDAVTNWLDVDPSRRQYALRLLECVRVPLIPEPIINDAIEKTDWVAANPDCMTFVEEVKDCVHHIGRKELKPAIFRLRQPSFENCISPTFHRAFF
ncbi:hypothetical protein PMAYCL1PPCAC_13553 [Pristionchus mayeri]|uniref:BTB domain-containing protein n=1 Tax=Pristionchus mayeri TaxID=1317129 RepID=A0AAN4ZLC2_9BILA|nr:hypothetical protein PMAYCL1PPCAC_13553 [Pristionchus mayeri]